MVNLRIRGTYSTYKQMNRNASNILRNLLLLLEYLEIYYSIMTAEASRGAEA